MKNIFYLFFAVSFFTLVISMDRLTPTDPNPELDAEFNRLEMRIACSSYNNRKKLSCEIINKIVGNMPSIPPVKREARLAFLKGYQANTIRLFTLLTKVKADYRKTVVVSKIIKNKFGPIQDLELADEESRSLFKESYKQYENSRRLILQEFCQKRQPLNFIDSDNKGNTLLHRLVLYNLQDLVNQALDEGADANARNRKGRGPLHKAVQVVGSTTLNALLPYCDINAQDRYGTTPLMEAVKWTNETAVKFLLVQTNLQLDLRNYIDLTAFDLSQTSFGSSNASIIKALYYGKSCRLTLNGKKLLKKISSGQSQEEYFPLFFVPGKKIQSLIDCSPIADQQQPIIFLVPLAQRQPSVPKKIKYNLEKQDQLKTLVFKRDNNRLKKFLRDHQGSFDLNRSYYSFNSFLDFAVVSNNSFLCEQFLMYRATSDILSFCNKPLLLCALSTNIPKIMQLLLEFGANVHVCHSIDDFKIKNPVPLIYYAVTRSDYETIMLLCKAGARINEATDPHIGTPLHFAVTSKNFDAVKALLDAGAKTDIPDGNGEIPLHLAVKEAGKISESIVGLLLQHGSYHDLFVENDDAETPHSILCGQNRFGFILDWLFITLSKGAALTPEFQQKLLEHNLQQSEFVRLGLGGKIITDLSDPNRINFLVYLSHVNQPFSTSGTTLTDAAQ